MHSGSQQRLSATSAASANHAGGFGGGASSTPGAGGGVFFLAMGAMGAVTRGAGTMGCAFFLPMMRVSGRDTSTSTSTCGCCRVGARRDDARSPRVRSTFVLRVVPVCMQCLQLQAVTDRLCARTPQVGVRGVWLVRTCRVDSGKPTGNQRRLQPAHSHANARHDPTAIPPPQAAVPRTPTTRDTFNRCFSTSKRPGPACTNFPGSALRAEASHVHKSTARPRTRHGSRPLDSRLQWHVGARWREPTLGETMVSGRRPPPRLTV